MTNENSKFYYKTNRLQQLRGFYYAAQFESVSKAATSMGLAKSTVSMQIKSLEQKLGITLFEHNGPSIKLTPIGKKLYLESANFVEGINNLFQSFNKTIQDDAENDLDIGANEASMLYLLPEIIKKYLDKNKKSNIKISNAKLDKNIELLRNKEIDLVVGPNSFNIPFDYQYHPVFNYRPVVITPPNHPLAGKKNISFSDLRKYEILLPPSNLRTIKTIDELFIQHGIKEMDRLKFDNWEIIKKYVEVGIGITLAAEIAIEEKDRLVGTPIEHLLPHVTYGYIVKKASSLPKKVENFVEALENYTPPINKNILD